MRSLNIWLAYLGFTFKVGVTCPSSPAKMTKSINALTNALDHAASYMDADQFMLPDDPGSIRGDCGILGEKEAEIQGAISNVPKGISLKSRITVGGAKFMWRRRFPWSDVTALCSGEDQDIPVDGVSKGEVCSKSEQETLFHQLDWVFVAVGPSGGPSVGLFGAKGTRTAPDSDSNTQNWADRGMIPVENRGAAWKHAYTRSALLLF